MNQWPYSVYCTTQLKFLLHLLDYLLQVNTVTMEWLLCLRQTITVVCKSSIPSDQSSGLTYPPVKAISLLIWVTCYSVGPTTYLCLLSIEWLIPQGLSDSPFRFSLNLISTVWWAAYQPVAAPSTLPSMHQSRVAVIWWQDIRKRTSLFKTLQYRDDSHCDCIDYLAQSLNTVVVTKSERISCL